MNIANHFERIMYSFCVITIVSADPIKALSVFNFNFMGQSL
jgi:hypothetical protein